MTESIPLAGRYIKDLRARTMRSARLPSIEETAKKNREALLASDLNPMRFEKERQEMLDALPSDAALGLLISRTANDRLRSMNPRRYGWDGYRIRNNDLDFESVRS